MAMPEGPVNGFFKKILNVFQSVILPAPKARKRLKISVLTSKWPQNQGELFDNVNAASFAWFGI